MEVKKISKKKAALVFCLFSFIGFCQSLELPKNIQTPNASSLGKYGDLPINYYTGRVNVNVPVFATTESNIPLNISFNYDTGGVRVNELPSWVGQNWNMEAGGVITRTQKGYRNDDYLINLQYWPFSPKGYYYTSHLLDVAGWSNPVYLHSIAENEPMKDDFEPDIFTFNFLGITGKFFLGTDKKWRVQCDKNIKVDIDMSLAAKLPILDRNTFYPWQPDPVVTPKCLGKITLTDENGNVYIFGGTQNAIEYCQQDFFDYGSGVIANAWYLTTVLDRLGNEIYTFEYEKGDMQAHFYLSMYSKLREKSSDGNFFQPGGGCLYSEYTPLNASGSLIFPVYLTKITTRYGFELSFKRSISQHKAFNIVDNSILQYSIEQWEENHGRFTNWPVYQQYLLTNFYLFCHDQSENVIPIGSSPILAENLLSKIKNVKLDEVEIKLNNQYYKKIVLNRNPVQQRLNLIGVEIQDQEDRSNYQFQYNQFDQLPSLLSKAYDHWGYYKGTDFITVPWELHSLSRQPNPSYAQIGSMTKITYPTGGSSEFEFENNSYKSYVTYNNLAIYTQPEQDIAGGLRIKTITTKDNTKILNTKHIKYTDGINSNTSSGILSFKNVYDCPNWDIRTEWNTLYRESITSLNSIVTLANFSGSHIAYSKVFEIENSGGGYKEYNYTDFNDYPDIPFTNTISLSHSIFDAHISNDFKRGREKVVKFFKEGSSSPVREIENVYQSFGNNKARGFSYNQFVPCPTSGDAVVMGNAYEIEYSDFKLEQTTETDYFNGNAISKTTSYTYQQYPSDSNFYGDTFLNYSSLTDFSGESQSVEYIYPFQYASLVNTAMKNAHFFPVVASNKFGNGGISDFVSGIRHEYAVVQLVNGGSYPMIIRTEISKGEEAPYTDIVIDKYNKFGKILQYHKEDGINIACTWSNTDLMLSSAENATWDENYGLFPVFNSNPEKTLTKYNYDSLRNLTRIIFPNGVIENYYYDINNRLEKITDSNDKTIKKFEYHIR